MWKGCQKGEKLETVKLAVCGNFGTLFVICIICLQMMKNENFRWILQTMANSASMMSFKSKGCSKPRVLCSESSLLVTLTSVVKIH